MTGDWFEETLHPGLHTRLRIDKLLYEGNSDLQHLILFENPEFGRVLALNGVVQTTERDEFIYHEMLAHLPLFAHGAAREVLIIGGGDGGMLEEVLKHQAVTRATLVEIDAGVIEFSKEYLRSICGNAFEDPRTEIVIADGVDHVETTNFQTYAISGFTDPFEECANLISLRQHFRQLFQLSFQIFLSSCQSRPFIFRGFLFQLATLQLLFRFEKCGFLIHLGGIQHKVIQQSQQNIHTEIDSKALSALNLREFFDELIDLHLS